MADASITVSAVKKTNNTESERANAGATVAAGEMVYADSTDSGDYKLADADNTAATATVKGMALNSASDGQPLEVATGGKVTLDGLTAGTLYVLSGSPGKICPAADLLAGDYVDSIGVATAATEIDMSIINSGVLLT